MKPASYWRSQAKKLREHAEYTFRPDMPERYEAAFQQALGYDRMAELAERSGAPKPVEEECGTCHFQRHTQCHRYPPTRPDPNDGRATRHIHVEEHQWCGEWKAKP